MINGNHTQGFKVEPFHDYLWLTVEAAVQSKILIPEKIDQAGAGLLTFRVAAVGPECKFAKVGDHLFNIVPVTSQKQADGKTYYIVKEEFIAGRYVK